MQVEDDFTTEEIELANRLHDIEAAIDDMSELSDESAELVSLGIVSQDQVDRTMKNLAEAKSLQSLFERRLVRMVNRRRKGAE